jgi:hypothetical protein
MKFLPQFDTVAPVLERPDQLRWVLSSYRRTRSSQTFGESLQQSRQWGGRSIQMLRHNNSLNGHALLGWRRRK